MRRSRTPSATRSKRAARRPLESARLARLPVYVFADLDRRKAEKRRAGVDLIDLGMGNPDLPAPATAVAAMQKAIGTQAHHRYPEFRGLPEFRRAAADWCRRRHGADLDPDTEVVPLLGSKEGLVHLALSILSRGDVTLLPLPAYPAHIRGTVLADATPRGIPQRPARDLFGPRAAADAPDDLLPDLDAIPASALRRARLLLLSFPTNPTAYCAPRALFEQALAFARRHDLVLVHDFAYSEVGFDGYRPPSLMALPGAKRVAVEFHSFSKTFSMAGWRLAFATGNADILNVLMKFKSNCDYGVFQAAQEAGIAALASGDAYVEEMRATYRRRRDLVVAGLRRLGFGLAAPAATMYLWVEAPRGTDGGRFAQALLDRTGVVVTPGAAFGSGGGKHVRIALVAPEDRLAEALRRIEKAGLGPAR